jgi:hypothetical protein
MSAFRKAYDGIYADRLPKDGDLYLGYDDGNWPDAAEEVKLFPGKLVVLITTNPNDNKGIIGDGPPDNGTWQQWVGWVVKRRAAGEDPWINTNKSNWVAGKLAFAVAKVPEPHWWIAWYNNDPTLIDGSPMKQFASNNDYDTSSCASYLPGIDPKPTTTPTPVVDEEDDMAKFEKTSNPVTGRAGIGFAEGLCNTFQVTCDKGQLVAADTFRFIIVLDSGPDVVIENQSAPNGKAVVHVPQPFFGKASGVIVYGPKNLEYELYAQ